MDANLKNELDEILAGKKAKDNYTRQTENKQEAEHQEFQNKFISIRDSAIKPAMEEIVKYLSDQNLGAVIDTQEEVRHSHYGKLASITIRLTLNYKTNHQQPHYYPHLSVIADTATKKIKFEESTAGIGYGDGGGSSDAGECSLIALTQELVHTKIMKILRASI
ncbi:MAG: hypothetical protein JKX78_00045 [Alteromonadaceae bacterium]|nr:hypothetical protein [Alteromonadaceae bacterium]